MSINNSDFGNVKSIIMISRRQKVTWIGRVRGEGQVEEGDWQALLQVETPANQKSEFYRNSTSVPQILQVFFESLNGL